MHIFKYSRRRGTVADKMDNQIDEKIKTERSAQLIKLEQKMSKEYREFYLGKTVDILIEEKVEIDGVSYYAGYTKNYIRVVIPVGTLDNLAINNTSVINTIVEVKCDRLS